MDPKKEPKWLNIEYLAGGTPTQQIAYQTLKSSNILNYLKAFHPTLVGTIPLDIDIPGSDLDILCEVYEFAPFAALVQKHYGHLPDFYQNAKELNGVLSYISRFIWELDGTLGNSGELLPNIQYPSHFPIEIVAQPIPVTEQRAYRHMLAEAYLLEQGGESAREAIRALKLSGMKTEPAFGYYFGLKGDAYQTLLELDQNPCYEAHNGKVSETITR